MSAYLKPDTIDEAIAALTARPELRIVAGGTDVYPALGTNLPRAALLDLSGVTALRGISQDDSGLAIGALASWSELQRMPLAPGYRALQQAGREVGSPQIQNAATVVGNLCNASPAADGTVALIVLDAQVLIDGPAGARRVPVADFVTGVRQVALAPGEIVTALHLPATRGRSQFLKLGARKYLVISIAMVAVYLETDAAGHITRAALAVGSCSPVARRLPALEAALIGAGRDDLADILRPDLIEGLAPISDVRAEAGYRAAAVPVLLRRALETCLEA